MITQAVDVVLILDSVIPTILDASNSPHAEVSPPSVLWRRDKMLMCDNHEGAVLDVHELLRKHSRAYRIIGVNVYLCR
jgi:hypothetical protein